MLRQRDIRAKHARTHGDTHGHTHTHTHTHQIHKRPCHWIAILLIFLYPTGLPRQNLEAKDITIWVGFGMQVAKTLAYRVVYTNFHFLLHYVIIIRQRYKRTNGRTCCM